MGETRERWMVIPAGEWTRPRHIRDVEDDGAAVDVAHVRPVRASRVDVGVVGPEARVELRVAGRRRLRVTVACAGQPPPADLCRPRRDPHVHDPVALVVLRVARLEVGGAACDVDEASIHEPQMVDAPRVWTGRVEEGN